MLRASGNFDLRAVVDQDVSSGVEHGEEISELVDATIGSEWDVLAELREKHRTVLGDQYLVDVLTVASSFNGITRIADATGIPVDPDPAKATVEIRSDLGIDDFHYDVKASRYS